MKIINISFDHTKKTLSESIGGMAFKEVLNECFRNYDLEREQIIASGRDRGCTSEVLEVILKVIPDELTKEEVAIAAAFMGIEFYMMNREKNDPLALLAKLMRDGFGKDLE